MKFIELENLSPDRLLKVLKSLHGITHTKDLASKLGVSYSTLAPIEAGSKSCSQMVLRKIAKEFSLDIGVLMQSAALYNAQFEGQEGEYESDQVGTSPTGQAIESSESD